MSDHIHIYGPPVRRPLPGKSMDVLECQCRRCAHVQILGYSPSLSSASISNISSYNRKPKRTKRRYRRWFLMIGIFICIISAIITFCLFQINSSPSPLSETSIASSYPLTETTMYMSENSHTFTMGSSVYADPEPTTLETTRISVDPLPEPSGSVAVEETEVITSIATTLSPSTTENIPMTTTVQLPISVEMPSTTEISTMTTTIFEMPSITTEIPTTEVSTTAVIITTEPPTTQAPTEGIYMPLGAIYSGEEVLAYIKAGNAAEVKIREDMIYSYSGNDKEPVTAPWPLTDSFILSRRDDTFVFEKF